MPKVSVVVPVYNVQQYVGKCLDSILAQTMKDFELLVIDDGATDQSGKICDEYSQKDSRVQVIHQKNQGLGGARNTGIEAAGGEYLLFVDSDDWIEPYTLEKALVAAESTGADISLFAFRSVDELGKTVQVFRESLPKNQALKIKDCKDIYLTAPCAWNKLYRSELFARTGVRYPPRVWYEDIRTTLKLFLAADKAVFIDDVCYNYLLREGSITKNVNADRNVEIIDAFDDILAYFKEQGAFEAYAPELCYLTLFHVYLTGSVRVINIDRRHGLLARFRTYLRENFPEYRKSVYLSRLGRNRRLIFSLLEKKMYGLVYLIFKIKG